MRSFAYLSVIVFGTALLAQEEPRLTVQAGHNISIDSASFSPDGKWIASGGEFDGVARLWDAATGRLVRTFRGHPADVVQVAFLPDGRLLTGGAGGVLRLWDVRTGESIRAGSSRGEFASISGTITVEPRGRLVATLDYNKVLIWNIDRLEIEKELATHTDKIRSVAFSPDGLSVLTGSDDKSAKLTRIADGKVLQTFDGHKDYVRAVAFHPDGRRILTGSADRTARIWDVADGKELRSVRVDSFSVDSAGFAPDGKSFVAEFGLWNTDTGNKTRSFEGNRNPRDGSFSGDGKRLLVRGRDIRVFDVASGELVGRIDSAAPGVDRVAFDPLGKRVAIGHRDGGVRLWNLESGKSTRTFARGNPNPEQPTASGFIRVTAVEFNPRGDRIIINDDAAVGVWDTQNGTELLKFRASSSNDRAAVFSPNGKLIAAVADKDTFRIVGADDGKEIRVFQGHESTVSAVAFSADGKVMVSGGIDKTIRTWDAATGKPSAILHTGNHTIDSLRLSPDGKSILTQTSVNALLIDSRAGTVIRTFARTGRRLMYDVHSVDFTPDGSGVVTGNGDASGNGEPAAVLWDAATGKEIRTFRGHEARVVAVRVSPDGKLLLTGSADGTARLWELGTGRELCRLLGFNDGTWAVIDSEGRYDGSNDGNVPGLHWVVGDQVVELAKHKDRAYDPSLLGKRMGFDKRPLRKMD